MAGILITGANGVVGYPLRERLIRERVNYCSVSRRPTDVVDKNIVQWDLHLQIDDQVREQLLVAKLDTLIHCAPIWLLPNHLENLISLGIRRIVAFSSSSVISKQKSKDNSENQLVQQLIEGEEALKHICSDHNIAFTIFRPSMIYGYGRDQNVSHIANFIKKYGFMILVGQATGLRQPVHADDLVDASMTVLNESNTYNQTYHLAGAQVLSYRAMVEAIFVALQKRPKIISLPLPIFRLALKMAALFGRFSYTAEMADRMNSDLNYENSDAENDFSYAPQAFLSEPSRDLF